MKNREHFMIFINHKKYALFHRILDILVYEYV